MEARLKIGETLIQFFQKDNKVVLTWSNEEKTAGIELNGDILEAFEERKNKGHIKLGTIQLFDEELNNLHNKFSLVRNYIEKEDHIGLSAVLRELNIYIAELIKERERWLEQEFDVMLNQLFRMADISEKLEALKHEKEKVLEHIRYCFNLLFS